MKGGRRGRESERIADVKEYSDSRTWRQEESTVIDVFVRVSRNNQSVKDKERVRRE